MVTAFIARAAASLAEEFCVDTSISGECIGAKTGSASDNPAKDIVLSRALVGDISVSVKMDLWMMVCARWS